MIIRDPRQPVLVDREIILDERLSLTALGLLVRLIARPDDDPFISGPDDNDEIAAALTELDLLGYISTEVEQ